MRDRVQAAAHAACPDLPPCRPRPAFFHCFTGIGRMLFYRTTAGNETKEEIGMAHTYEELKTKTVAELREIAATIENEAVKGASQMNKEHLVEALCKALNLDMHKHKHTVGVNKTEIKQKIRALKAKRAEALAAKDAKALLIARSRIRTLRRKLRNALVVD